jgi:hypothetical protein
MLQIQTRSLAVTLRASRRCTRTTSRRAPQKYLQKYPHELGGIASRLTQEKATMPQTHNTPITCPYCNTLARLTRGREIYPHRPDLYSLNFWACKPCDAYVGCHKKFPGTTPLGRLANAELRAAKSNAHRAFDPLWQDGAYTRHQAYQWLSEALRIPVADCHIGMFDVDLCREVIAVTNQHRFEPA